ncbi:MAG: Wzy polymerase domain-containing protein [Pseudomonadales bacterium]
MPQTSSLFSLLVAATLAVTPFYFQQGPGGETLSIPYNNLVWIAALITISAAIFKCLQHNCLTLPRYWLAMAALPAGLTVSGLALDVVQPDTWLMRLGYIIAGYLFFIALFQARFTRRHIETLLFIISCAASIHAALAFTQLQGWHWTSLIPRTAGNHPISTIQQVNVLASLLTTGFFSALYLLSAPAQKSRSTFATFLLLFTLLTTTTMLLAIGSRTTLVSFAIAFPIWLIASFPVLKKAPKLTSAMLIFFAAGVGFGFNQSNGLEKYESKISQRTTHARTYIYDLSWQTFKQQPIFGYGLGSFDQVFQEAKIDYPEAKRLSSSHFSHPHNEILFWMIEGGAVSLLGLFIALGATLSALYKLGKRRGLRYFALLFPISFHTQVELPFYHSAALWFIWLLILFVIHSHQTKHTTLSLSRALHTLITTVTIGATTVMSVFFFHTLISLSGLTAFIKSRGTQLQYLSPATSNLYFRDLAELLGMRTLLIQSIHKKDTQGIEHYIKWADNLLSIKPNVDIYADLITAHSALGRRTLASNKATLALAMYPGSSMIMDKIQQFELKAAQDQDTGAEHN